MKILEKTDNNKTIDINLETIYNIAGNLETLIQKRRLGIMKKASYHRLYSFIERFAENRGLRNTLIALPLAVKYHEGQKRDDGEPYVMHPMRVCITLILLRPEFAFKEAYPKKSEKWVWQQCDILFSTALLHDVVEDAELPNKGRELVVVHYLSREVLKNVRILSKPPKRKKHFWSKVYKPKKYYKRIRKSLISTLDKLADRKDNCTTYGVFTSKRKVKYMRENEQYIYPLGEGCKKKHPEFARIVDVLIGIIQEKVKPYEYLLETGNLKERVNTC